MSDLAATNCGVMTADAAAIPDAETIVADVIQRLGCNNGLRM